MDGGGGLLYEQDSHVSKAIMNGVKLGAYQSINTNLDKKIWVLMNRQMDFMRENVTPQIRKT